MTTVRTKKPKTRLDFRLDVDSKEVITQAALVSGKSLSEFAVSSLVQSAQEVLEKHRTITFSNRDFDAFLEALDSEEGPNEALKQATEQYKRHYGGRGLSREPLTGRGTAHRKVGSDESAYDISTGCHHMPSVSTVI